MMHLPFLRFKTLGIGGWRKYMSDRNSKNLERTAKRQSNTLNDGARVLSAKQPRCSACCVENVGKEKPGTGSASGSQRHLEPVSTVSERKSLSNGKDAGWFKCQTRVRTKTNDVKGLQHSADQLSGLLWLFWNCQQNRTCCHQQSQKPRINSDSLFGHSSAGSRPVSSLKNS